MSLGFKFMSLQLSEQYLGTTRARQQTFAPGRQAAGSAEQVARLLCMNGCPCRQQHMGASWIGALDALEAVSGCGGCRVCQLATAVLCGINACCASGVGHDWPCACLCVGFPCWTAGADLGA